MVIDALLPAFAKLTPTREPEEDDPLKLAPDALSLDGLQAIYRNPALPLTTRMRAMMAAIPFESPKLAVVAQVSENDLATLLDKRIAKLREMEQHNNSKLIEAKPTNGIKENGGSADARLPPRVSDRRFRRV